MKSIILSIICTHLFVQINLFGQSHKLDGLWINTQYKMYEENKNQDLTMSCTPQYIDIDSLGNAIIISDIEHNINLGLPKKIIKFGSIKQYIYKKNPAYYITEIRYTNSFISLHINNTGIRVLFEKIKRPY